MRMGVIGDMDNQEGLIMPSYSLVTIEVDLDSIAESKEAVRDSHELLMNTAGGHQHLCDSLGDLWRLLDTIEVASRKED